MGRRQLDGQAQEGERAGRNSSQCRKKGKRSWSKAQTSIGRRNTVAASLCQGVGAVAVATWFESLAVAQFTRRSGRPLQRHLPETNLNLDQATKHANERETNLDTETNFREEDVAGSSRRIASPSARHSQKAD